MSRSHNTPNPGRPRTSQTPPEIRAAVTWELTEDIDDAIDRMTKLGVPVSRATLARKGLELAVAYYRDFAARLEGAKPAK